MSRFQFRDQWYALAPPWLTTGDAERYMYTLQLCSDLLCEKANQAIKIRFPGLGDKSQLPYLAHDRQLVQGVNEPNASFVGRLSGAFAAWAEAGSRGEILRQLGYGLIGKSPGVPATYPLMAIVGGSYPTVAAWDLVRAGDVPGVDPAAHYMLQTSNFNWDGGSQPWRSWLVLYQTPVAVPGLSGAAATVDASTSSACTSTPGHLVSGVWVPQSTGTPVNRPWISMSGLTGITTAQIGQWLTVSGSAHAVNNGTFPIVDVTGLGAVTIANPGGLVDAGPLAWSVSAYPNIAPAMPLGVPGAVWGAGEVVLPPVDSGSNVRGIWRPTLPVGANQSPAGSWALSCPASVISDVRETVRTWKSGPTWYVNIIVAFDGGAGTTGADAYSPLSSPGSGNPNGQFSSYGHNAGGVWVPVVPPVGLRDAYCQGTGSWSAASVPNVT